MRLSPDGHFKYWRTFLSRVVVPAIIHAVLSVERGVSNDVATYTVESSYQTTDSSTLPTMKCTKGRFKSEFNEDEIFRQYAHLMEFSVLENPLCPLYQVVVGLATSVSWVSSSVSPHVWRGGEFDQVAPCRRAWVVPGDSAHLMWLLLGSTRQRADTAEIALALSVVLVLLRYLPNGLHVDGYVPRCHARRVLSLLWITTQSSIDVESSAKVKTYTKRFRYAEILCTSLFEFPDGNISTVGTKRFGLRGSIVFARVHDHSPISVSLDRKRVGVRHSPSSLVLVLVCSLPIVTHLRPAGVLGRCPGGGHV